VRKKILIAIPALLILFLLVVALLPGDFRIQRSIVVNTDMEKAFQQANDFHKSNIWNPWMNFDPKIQISYEGPSSGVGATTLWTGNTQVGTGKMSIEYSTPNALVRIQEEYTKPFRALSTHEFTFRPQGAGTLVNWVIAGKMPYLPKVINVFVGINKMVGGGMEKGLAQFKQIAEQTP
jgi:hypothetical protein